MSTTEKRQRVLDIIKELVPKQVGVRRAYYKTEGNRIEVVFLVEEEYLSSLIGYLNSLPSIIESNVKGVKIESEIYINESTKEVHELTQKEELLPIALRSLQYA